MAYWLLKTEPSLYSYENLVKDKKTVWDGITNNLALQNIRTMKKGDLVFIYYSGNEKKLMGIAQLTSDPYPDPKLHNPKLVVIDLKPIEKLKRPVTLAEIKQDNRFKDFDLIKISRLSVVPVNQQQCDGLLELSNKS
jgi:predicted RNA-binding protein with PUA-like domain